MNDLIWRSAAIEAFDDERVNRNYGDVSPESVIEVIKSIPAVDVMPVIHGHWKDNGNGTVSCSCCATWFPKTRESQLLFCGYCGAKMDE